jgi:muramoyltetrapeptide carboxypeptidase
MKFPSYLLPGDKVAIISPAGIIEREIAERGAELLRQQGFRVEIGQHAFEQEGLFAGSDCARAADMQKVLDDKSIKAVFFSRGGYGSIRTHMKLNWSSFFKKPKWLIGFSDITVFHACLARGVYLAPSAYEAGFISTAHDGPAIDRACEIMSRAIAEL